MSGDVQTKAVFFDALGTLVELEPPWEHLRAKVGDRVGERELVAAVRKEMAYYKAHAHEGRDAASLAELRERCATLISGELGVEVTAAELVEAVRLRAYPDAVPALERVRELGLPAVVVSNWDCSLGDALARCGLDGLLDGAVSSAEAGSRKPEPGIFAPALELAGCEAGEAVHVGDTPEEDVVAANAAGIRPILVVRGDDAPATGPAAGATRVASLDEIAGHL